jgi:hypothetical protein
MDVKEVGTDITRFLAGILGVAAGQIVMGIVPSTKIDLVDKILPGAIGITGAVLVAGKFKDPHAKAASMGLGIAGTAKLVNNFTAGKSGILEKVHAATTLPEVNLKGFRGLGQAETMFLAAAPERVALPQARELFVS